MQRRIELIDAMDEWQLLHALILMVLPLRFEDVAGALISDIDFGGRTLRLGTRFGGGDFNKERLEVEMPLPQELLPILRLCAGDRPDGPLFRSRAAWEQRMKPRLVADSRNDIERLFDEALAQADADDVQTEQDRKAVCRELLRQLGGISESQIGKAIKLLLGRIGLADKTRPYDLRGSVTTDMKAADVRHLELRYLTVHSVNDILGEYTGLDPINEMAKYFRQCEPLLHAILDRASSLNIPLS